VSVKRNGQPASNRTQEVRNLKKIFYERLFARNTNNNVSKKAAGTEVYNEFVILCSTKVK